MNHKLDTDSQVFFYEQDFYVFSNFSSFAIHWKGLRFDTAEAVYHWEKFNWEPEDDVRFREVNSVRYDILTTASAHAAFKTAESNSRLRRPDWDEIKVDVMRQIIRAKTDQHEYVRRKLLATGNRTLIEDSWRDFFWGWGEDHQGQNMLGKLWMELREELGGSKL